MRQDFDKRAEKLRRPHDLRVLSREAASGAVFFLSYTRTGPFEGRPPIVVVPGGPGLGSVAPYAMLRAWAKKSRVDLIMVEHRGVGFSRRTSTGDDLTEDDMWLRYVVEDLLAVLDAEHVSEAVLYGCSYGSYVVQAFAAEHSDRVAGLVIDSAVLSAHDHHHVREASRTILWDGGTEATGRLAPKLRKLISDGTVTQPDAEAVARIVYEFCGPATLERLLDQVHAGRGGFAWRRIAALDEAETQKGKPFVMEFDLVGTIAFRELNYAPEPDGGPFDPGVSFAKDAARFPAFQGEEFDLRAALSSLRAPVVVLSGERDLRTPRAVAELVAGTAPNGHLVPVGGAGHSLLDANRRAAHRVLAAISDDGPMAVPELGDELAAIAGKPSLVSLATYVKSLVWLSRLIPARRAGKPL